MSVFFLLLWHQSEEEEEEEEEEESRLRWRWWQIPSSPSHFWSRFPASKRKRVNFFLFFFFFLSWKSDRVCTCAQPGKERRERDKAIMVFVKTPTDTQVFLNLLLCSLPAVPQGPAPDLRRRLQVPQEQLLLRRPRRRRLLLLLLLLFLRHRGLLLRGRQPEPARLPLAVPGHQEDRLRRGHTEEKAGEC